MSTLARLALALVLLGCSTKDSVSGMPDGRGPSSDLDAPPATDPGDAGPTEVSGIPPLGEFEVLPAPADLPTGTIDEAAAALARSVVQGGPAAIPALLTAFASCGVAVVDENGTVLAAPASGARYTIAAWEVQALAQDEAIGFTLELGELADTVRGFSPESADMPFEVILAEALEDQMTNATATATDRFFASFVVALSSEAAVPRDLLYGGPTTQLDAVQVSLVVRELAMEAALVSLAARAPAKVATSQAAADTSGDCRLTEAEAKVLDATSAGLTLLFNRTVKYLAHHGVEELETAEKMSSWANVALTWAQIVEALFLTDYTVEVPDELRRTTSARAPGEKVKLSAHIESKIPDSARWLSCMRTLLNMAGLDPGNTSTGNLAEVNVSWSLLDGADRLEFADEDPFHGTMTDEHGDAIQHLEGRAQIQALPANAIEDRHPARVVAYFTLKPAELFRDIHDSLPVGYDPVAWFGVPAELILRSRFLLHKSADFTVVDHHAPAWSGAITFSEHGHGSKVNHKDEDAAITDTRLRAGYDVVETYSFPLSVAIPGATPQWVAYGEVVGDASESAASDTTFSSFCEAEGELGTEDLETDEDFSVVGHMELGAFPVTLRLDGAGNLSIDLPFAPITMTGQHRLFTVDTRSGCPNPDENGTTTTPITLDAKSATADASSRALVVPVGDQEDVSFDLPFTDEIDLGIVKIAGVKGNLHVELHRER